jgi:hypothetical protein
MCRLRHTHNPHVEFLENAEELDLIRRLPSHADLLAYVLKNAAALSVWPERMAAIEARREELRRKS